MHDALLTEVLAAARKTAPAMPIFLEQWPGGSLVRWNG
jgi:hypothetical protein